MQGKESFLKEKDTGKRYASNTVALGCTAVIAAALTGCVAYDNADVPQPSQETTAHNYAQMCQDVQTGNRVSDEYCEVNDEGQSSGSSPNYSLVWLPLWLNMSRPVPAVGSPIGSVNGLEKTAPTGGSTVYTPSASGDKVTGSGELSKTAERVDTSKRSGNSDAKKPSSKSDKGNMTKNGSEKGGFGSKGSGRASSGGHASSGG
jgi:hypothetical protein